MVIVKPPLRGRGGPREREIPDPAKVSVPVAVLATDLVVITDRQLAA